MKSITFFLIFIPILSLILLLVNFLLAVHKPNKDKDAQFECGFSSFIAMSRMAFTISFFIYALLFLLFDLEILLVYPYVISSYNNDAYGLIIMLIFFILLTIGFIYELGTKALLIDSRQNLTNIYNFNLRSDLLLIISELNNLLPQLSSFIDQFNTIQTINDITVLTDSFGNLSIDVPKDMSDYQAQSLSKKIGIIDRLITTQEQKITGLLSKGINHLPDDENAPELIKKIFQFKSLYKH